MQPGEIKQQISEAADEIAEKCHSIKNRFGKRQESDKYEPNMFPETNVTDLENHGNVRFRRE